LVEFVEGEACFGVGREGVFELFFDVAGDEVGFDVNEVAWSAVAEVGFGEGGGDEGDGAVAAGELGDGEADAVDGDGAFGDDEVGEFVGEGNGEAVLGGGFVDAFDGGDGVDVALDDVASKAAGGGQGSFEVEALFWFEVLEGGGAEGFGHDVEGGVGLVERGDGEAGAVDGDAVAGAGVVGEVGEVDAEASACGGRFVGDEGLDGFDESGEHGSTS